MPMTTIGLAVPTAARATPRLVDTHVAVYFGVVSGLPFVCAPVRFVNETRNRPAAILTAVGVATRAGAPTVIAGEGADAALVPTWFVSVTVHVYTRFSVAPPTVIGTAVAPTCTPDFVAPPLVDLHIAVNLVIAEP
jgi:hypothetical protein